MKKYSSVPRGQWYVRFKYPITYWCVTRRERAKRLFLGMRCAFIRSMIFHLLKWDWIMTWWVYYNNMKEIHRNLIIYSYCQEHTSPKAMTSKDYFRISWNLFQVCDKSLLGRYTHINMRVCVYNCFWIWFQIYIIWVKRQKKVEDESIFYLRPSSYLIRETHY